MHVQLRALGCAIEHCLAELGNEYPLVAYDRIVLEKYLCVPRELATFKPVQSSVMSRANDVDISR